MALSVLVALMMLAVPLASSSNLFVDGGQTNSNGDAPVLGDNLSPRVDFILNESTTGRISLDSVDTAALVAALNNAPYNTNTAWYVGENGNIFAIVNNTESKNVTMQYLIWALTAVNDGQTSPSPLVSKVGYTVDSWKSDSAVYSPISTNPSAGDRIIKDTTVTAKWNLMDEHVEVPVDVVFDGKTLEPGYVQVYKYENADKKTVKVDDKALESKIVDVADIDIYGVVINSTSAVKVYSDGAVTYNNGQKLPSNDIISSENTLTVTYEFDGTSYSKLIVSSIAFENGEDVTLYVNNADSTYSYFDVLKALSTDIAAGVSPVTPKIDKAIALKMNGSNIVITNHTATTIDDYYDITGWNAKSVLLESKNNVPAGTEKLTLDAELNGYYVLFMSKGQFEYVYVPSGDLSADLVKTLDITGVNHWAWIKYGDDAITSNSFKTFGSFTDSLVSEVEDMIPEKYDGETPIAVFVACFESIDNTAYAVFDGDGANFGNEYVTKLIIPGKIATKIVKPTIAPVYDQDESRTLFMGWNKQQPASVNALSNTSPDSNDDVYGKKGEVTTYKANPQLYDYMITFYDGSEVVGVFYYKDGTPNSTAGIDNGLVAIGYDGMVYAKTDVNIGTNPQNAATKAYLNVLEHSKAGYDIKQWNDVDGKSMYIVATAKVNISDMKDDLDLYAQFDAKSYTIKYVNTFEGTQNQIAYVDQNTTLYGTGTFIHEGYDLKAWSTVPGNSGDKYDLGATFVLNGADFEKLAESAGDDGVVIELYSVWEYNGGSDVPGGNTGGDSNDNTALYLIAGMLAVIAILAIVGIVLMRKK